MKTTHVENADGSITITIKLDSDDVLALKHNLPGVQGIVDWFAKGPSSEKTALCRKRMIKENRESLLMQLANEGKADRIKVCMSNEKELCKEIAKMASYKNREARDKESESLLRGTSNA